jgi:hypothetical protein
MRSDWDNPQDWEDHLSETLNEIWGNTSRLLDTRVLNYEDLLTFDDDRLVDELEKIAKSLDRLASRFEKAVHKANKDYFLGPDPRDHIGLGSDPGGLLGGSI